MSEIARAVGVSSSTVSRVLNGSRSTVPIAPATKRRVLEAARKMGYRPNPLARGLRGAGTALLGLIVRDFSDPFFARAIEVIVAEVRRKGYNLVLGYARSSGDEALALAGALETRHCEGIILLGDLRYVPEVWADLIKGTVPVVALCDGPRSPGIPTVNTDNRLGINMALGYLYKLGHRRFGYIDAGWIGDAAERRQAYADFLIEHRLKGPSGEHQQGENEIGAGRAAFERLIGLAEPPTAVVCATDRVAVGALAGALLAGVKVPQEMSVIGFDDIPLGQFTVPALTTVRQPLEEMVNLAVEEVLAIIRGDKSSGASIRSLKPTLTVRDSCARPRTGPLRAARFSAGIAKEAARS